jgi:hypothetical protein
MLFWKNLCCEGVTNEEGKMKFVQGQVFQCDNNGHLVKGRPKPPHVSDCISHSKLIIQGGFMGEIRAYESKTSNLLKLNYKINNEIVGCFLDVRVTNSFMTPYMAKRLGIKTKLVASSITMQMAQGINRPSFNVTLNVELFFRGVQLFENFTLCDLNNFDEIIGKKILDAYILTSSIMEAS